MPSSAHRFGRSTWTDVSFHFAYIPVRTCVPRGAVADFERPGQGPVVVDGAACRNHGAKSVLQAFAIAGLASNFNVGYKAEERAAPVGSAPGVGAIEAPWSPG